MMILPRQARDKHMETQKKPVLSQVLGMQEEADVMGVDLPWERVATPAKL
jgi:hypothetical protein